MNDIVSPRNNFTYVFRWLKKTITFRMSPNSPSPRNNFTYVFCWPFGNASFDDVTQHLGSFFTQIDSSLVDNLNRRLGSMGIGSSGVLLVQAVNIATINDTYTVTFSAEGQRLLGLGQLSIMNGQRPLLVDSAGKIVEMGRITSNIAPVVASVTSLVVATAHLIATRDLVQRIELLQHNVNWLIKARQIDQWATFERIFYAAREICAQPIDETARMELWRMRQELREQRIRLRREWQAKLAEIKIEPLWVDQLPPNIFEWISRDPLIRKMYDNALAQEQKKTTQALDQTLSYPLLIELGWRLEHVLAVASQTELEFGMSISNEVEEVAKIVQTIAEKGQRIKLQYWLVEPYNDLVDRYRQLSRLALGSASPA